VIDRLVIFAFTGEEVANMGDFPFGALIDSKISHGEYKEVRDVCETETALYAVGDIPARRGHKAAEQHRDSGAHQAHEPDGTV
jgi:hypothetical protein